LHVGGARSRGAQGRNDENCDQRDDSDDSECEGSLDNKLVPLGLLGLLFAHRTSLLTGLLALLILRGLRLSGVHVGTLFHSRLPSGDIISSRSVTENSEDTLGHQFQRPILAGLAKHSLFRNVSEAPGAKETAFSPS